MSPSILLQVHLWMCVWAYVHTILDMRVDPKQLCFPLISILGDEKEAVAQNEKEKATSLWKGVLT